MLVKREFSVLGGQRDSAVCRIKTGPFGVALVLKRSAGTEARDKYSWYPLHQTSAGYGTRYSCPGASRVRRRCEFQEIHKQTVPHLDLHQVVDS